MKATIKITSGASGWWITPEGFFENDGTTPLDLERESADELRRVTIKRLFNLPRWGGEEGPHGPVSVGVHSLLVSFLAGRLAMARDCSDEIIMAAKSIGAAHDLGERLGPGDIVSPILRAYPETKAMNEEFQKMAFSLFEPWGRWPHGASTEDVDAMFSIIKGADHLAATIERRYLFGDSSGDREAPDADSMMDEIGIMGVDVWLSAGDQFCIEVKTLRSVCQIADDPVYASELERAIKCEL